MQRSTPPCEEEENSAGGSACRFFRACPAAAAAPTSGAAAPTRRRPCPSCWRDRGEGISVGWQLLQLLRCRSCCNGGFNSGRLRRGGCAAPQEEADDDSCAASSCRRARCPSVASVLRHQRWRVQGLAETAGPTCECRLGAASTGPHAKNPRQQRTGSLLHDCAPSSDGPYGSEDQRRPHMASSSKHHMVRG